MEGEPGDRPAGVSLMASTESPGPHALSAVMLRFDLGAEAERLRQQPSYGNGKPAGRTLVKEPDLRIVVMALRSGARLEEHRASGPISVQALQGTVRLHVLDDSVNLTPGELLTLEPGISHDVVAVEDAVFLLTIGRTAYGQVSDHHEPHS